MGARKILCPIDFSPGSDHALRIAAKLASKAQCELVISHAWYVPQVSYTAGDWLMPTEVVEAVMEDDESGLEAAARTATALGAPKVTPLLHAGPPGEQIVRVAREDPAFDLIVIGTHGRTGMERVLIGSVAEVVVRHAPCSVLVARASQKADVFKTVLVPTDFGEHSRPALNVAAQLAEPGGTGIVLFHALELPASYSRDLTMTDALGELDRLSTHALDDAVTKLRRRVNVAVTSKQRVGRAGRALLDELDEVSYDLVVMGSHNRRAVWRLLLGSVAEKVVRHARCPVLVAR